MTAIIVSVLLAIASGLAALAYKMPSSFVKLYRPLQAAVITITAIGFAWSVGYASSLRAMIPFLDKSTLAEAYRAHSQSDLGTEFLMLNGAALVYLIFLRWLAQEVFDHRYNEKPEQKMPNEQSH